MADKFRTKLTVKSQKQIASFKNKKTNEDQPIYEVKAVDEEGQEVKQKLRTFHAELPVGELIEYDVTPYDHEEHGRSYTIAIPSKGRASKKDISELRSQYTGIADRVGALELEVQELRNEVSKLRGLPVEDKPF